MTNSSFVVGGGDAASRLNPAGSSRGKTCSSSAGVNVSTTVRPNGHLCPLLTQGGRVNCEGPQAVLALPHRRPRCSNHSPTCTATDRTIVATVDDAQVALRLMLVGGHLEVERLARSERVDPGDQAPMPRLVGSMGVGRVGRGHDPAQRRLDRAGRRAGQRRPGHQDGAEVPGAGTSGSSPDSGSRRRPGFGLAACERLFSCRCTRRWMTFWPRLATGVVSQTSGLMYHSGVPSVMNKASSVSPG